MPKRTLAAAAASLAILTACAWWGDERAAIRARLQSLKQEVNADSTAGLSSMTRAAAVASYFTDDVVVELGGGSTPIVGREMLMGMATRLQPRTSEYQVELADISVELGPDGHSAGVALTAEFIPHESGGRRSMDAREFNLTMRREDGEWRIARVVAVQTLK
jgi:hypothetical protein